VKASLFEGRMKIDNGKMEKCRSLPHPLTSTLCMHHAAFFNLQSSIFNHPSVWCQADCIISKKNYYVYAGTGLIIVLLMGKAQIPQAQDTGPITVRFSQAFDQTVFAVIMTARR